MKAGQLWLSLNLGDGKYRQLRLPNAKMNDGAWHKVRLARVGSAVELSVDGGEASNYARLPLDDQAKHSNLPLSPKANVGLENLILFFLMPPRKTNF